MRWWNSPTPPDSHGEFGLAVDSAEKVGWAQNRQTIIEWLHNCKTDQEEIIRALLSDNNQGLLKWLENELPLLIDDVVNSQEIVSNGLAERLAEGAILPMYGMPSRTRLLYHRLTRDGAQTIDRDLELSITEFAPGSEKTKDKVIHRAVGFTAPLRQIHNRWYPSNNNPLPFRRWMQRCRDCGYSSTTEIAEAEDACPFCGIPGGPNSQFSQFQITVPQAYRTDLSRGADAKEDLDTFRGIPSAIAQSEAVSWDILSQTNCIRSLSGNGRIWRINSNAERLFEGGIGETSGDWDRGIPSVNYQWIDKHQWIDTHFTQISVQTERFALAAGKYTDILRISPASVPDGLNLNPFHHQSRYSVRASIISAAFLLQRVIAHKLQIEPDEIEVAGISKKPLANHSIVADMALSDRLPNGAGFVSWAYNNLFAILSDIYRGTDTFASGLIQPTHNCDSACYNCLKVYRNMTYHGLLDWRLALSYIKVLYDPQYQAGLNGSFTNAELEGWQQMAESLRDNFIAYFGYQSAIWGVIPGIIAGQRRILVIHPFWDTLNPQGILAEAVAAAGGEVSFIDTFNLLRRPGWCHEQLAGQQV
jgi:hypothetical protein